jgi:hypothetical protein
MLDHLVTDPVGVGGGWGTRPSVRWGADLGGGHGAALPRRRTILAVLVAVDVTASSTPRP